MYELLKILNEAKFEAKVLCSENERYDIEILEGIKPYYVSKTQIPKSISDNDIVIN